MNKQSNSIKKTTILHQIESNIDFGFLPVGVETFHTIKIHNYHDFPVEIAFTECAFKIEPKKAIILPEQLLSITICCQNSLAKIIVTRTFVTVEKEGNKSIKMSAFFKLAYLKIPSEISMFDNCFVDSIKELAHEILNLSDVSAHFEIKDVDNSSNIDNSIICVTKKGILLPRSVYKLQFEFRPVIESFNSSKHFELITNNTSSQYFEVKGQSETISIKIDRSFHDFGHIKKDLSAKTQFVISNKSQKTAFFQILNVSGMFAVDNSCGSISALSTFRFQVFFNPENVGVFQTKIYLLIKNQDIKVITLMGTCYVLGHLPPVEKLKSFKIEHENNFYQKNSSQLINTYCNLNLFNTQSKQNLKKLCRNSIDNGYKQEIIKSDTGTVEFASENKNIVNFQIKKRGFCETPLKLQSKATLQMTQKCQSNSTNKHEEKMTLFGMKTTSEKISEEKNSETNQRLHLFKDFYEENNENHELIKLSQTFIDFGSTNIADNNEVSRIISISNPDDQKWLHILPSLNSNVFKVSADAIELPPKRNAELVIYFNPNCENKFYYKSLSLYISNQKIFTENLLTKHKLSNMPNKSSFKTIEIQVKLAGNTFLTNASPSIPIFEVSPPSEIVFSPCQPNESAFKCLTITNKSDFAIFVKLKKIQPPFFCNQKFVYIQKNRMANVVFRFLPSKVNNFRESLTVCFNLDYNKKFILKGVCHNNVISIQNEGNLFISPCFIGIIRNSNFWIQNVSKARSKLEIKVPDNHKNEVKFEPSDFVLSENERINVQCTFLPRKFVDYQICCPVTLLEEEKERQVSRVSLSCRTGNGPITFENSSLHFGFVKVNFVQRKKLLIKNQSDFLFKIFLKLQISDENSENSQRILSFFELSFQETIVQSHTLQELWITFYPKEVCQANVKLVMISVSDFEDVKIEDFLAFESKKQIKELIKKKQELGEAVLHVKGAQFSGSSSLLNQHFKLKKKPQLPFNARAIPETIDEGNEEISEGSQEEYFLKKGFQIKDECQIEAEANFPQLKVVDMYCDDLSLASLWSMFQISEINSELTGKNTATDVNAQKFGEELHNSENPLSLPTKKHFLWDFGYLPSASEEKSFRTIRITIQNTGKTDLEWKLLNLIKKPTLDALNSQSDCTKDLTRNENSDEDEFTRFKIKPKLN